MGNKYKRNRYEELINNIDRGYNEVDPFSDLIVDAGLEPDFQACSSADSQIVLRRAVALDSLFIGSLSRQVFSIYGPYEEILLKWFMLEKSITTILACRNNIRLGFAMLSEPCARYNLPDASELLGIAVVPEKQGKGIGRMLLSAIDSVSLDLGIKWLLLHTAVDNLPARRLYEKIGYKPLEVKRWFYPEGQDAVAMFKQVQTSP
jgi:ribosomal protein S18 acetylase RimI-like enzyme